MRVKVYFHCEIPQKERRSTGNISCDDSRIFPDFRVAYHGPARTTQFSRFKRQQREPKAFSWIASGGALMRPGPCRSISAASAANLMLLPAEIFSFCLCNDRGIAGPIGWKFFNISYRAGDRTVVGSYSHRVMVTERTRRRMPCLLRSLPCRAERRAGNRPRRSMRFTKSSSARLR